MNAARRLTGLVAFLALVMIGRAEATYRTDRMELQARIAVQNTFHHAGTDDIEWVQEQNEFRFDLKYDMIPRGERFWLVRKARMNLLYRGRYDAIFDIRGKYGDLGYTRDDFRFPEGKYPREAFLDLEFDGFFDHLGLRLGRQQVVWGEADLFRSIDVINPLRLDQNGLIGNDFSDYREPLWIAKAIYDIGQVGPVANVGVEGFGSLNWRPLTDRIIVGEAFRIGVDTNNSLTGFNRQNSRPFDEVRHPWEVSRVGPYATEAPDQADLGDTLGTADFVYLIENEVPTSVFDTDAFMAGVRVSGQTFLGLDFTLNYIRKRSEVPGTALRGGALFDPDIAQNGQPNARLDLLAQAAEGAAISAVAPGAPGSTEDLIRRCIFEKEPLFVLDSIHGPRPDGSENASTGCLPVPFWYPWTNILGLTLTYNDYNYTGAIFRLEQSWSSKEPRNAQPPLAGVRRGDFPHTRDFETEGRRHTEVYRSMLGFDYLRAFALPAARKWPQPFRSLLTDQWFFSAQLLNEYYTHVNNQIGLLDSITDRMQHFNPVATFVATGFFMNNRLRPWLAAGYDVNAEFPVFWLQAEYHINKYLTVRAGEIIYAGSKFAESFLFLHKYADRDTTFVRLTFWLL